MAIAVLVAQVVPVLVALAVALVVALAVLALVVLSTLTSNLGASQLGSRSRYRALVKVVSWYHLLVCPIFTEDSGRLF